MYAVYGAGLGVSLGVVHVYERGLHDRMYFGEACDGRAVVQPCNWVLAVLDPVESVEAVCVAEVLACQHSVRVCAGTAVESVEGAVLIEDL